MKRETLRKNNYLLCGGSFFSTNISCFLVSGLYFFAESFTLAKVKLSAKKYNPDTRKHEMFVEKKLPPHSK